MIKNSLLQSKHVLMAILTISIILVVLPLLFTTFIHTENHDSQPKSTAVSIPKYITVHITGTGKTIKIPFEEYITCVTASEVPSSFHEEAIKAQSVAARTYALAKIEKYQIKHPSSHPKSPICNSTHCQVYHSEKELISSHKVGWDKTGFAKIKKAVSETKGQALYYEDKLVMQPLFFSSSGGRTENSEDVFVSAYPYLKSVISPYESTATHQNEKKTFKLSTLKKKLSKSFKSKDFSALSLKSIKILEKTEGGRVSKIKLGGEVLSGTEVRNALDLSSALFSIYIKDHKVIFKSNGSGHGVGLSQHGANGMAKEGFGYKEILKHYYSGVSIE